MKEAHCALRFCDYCLERRVCIYNLTSSDHLKIRGSNLHTETFGEQSNISNLCQFQWYNWCYFREITRPLSLTIKKYSVASSALLEGKEMNRHNGSSNPMAMLCLVEQFSLCNLLNFIVIWKNGNELFLICSLRGDGDHQ